MKSKRLFSAIGNIDDKFIDEDEEVTTMLKRQKARKTWSVYRFAGLAACVAVLILCVWTIPGLFNTPNNPTGQADPLPPQDEVLGGISDRIPDPDNSKEDGNSLIPGEPDEEWPNNPGEPAHEEPPCMLSLKNGYGEFFKLYALLEQDDESIAAYLDSYDKYYMNRLQTRADIENLFSTLDKLYFPFIDGAEATDTIIYLESGHATVRYEVNDMVFTFTLNANANWGFPTTAERIIKDWNDEIDGPLELLRNEDGVSIYLYKPLDVRGDGTFFVLNVRGVYTVAIVYNIEDPPLADLQLAIDGLFAFEFEKLPLK